MSNLLISALQPLLNDVPSIKFRTALNEISLDITVDDWPNIAYLLRDEAALSFKLCIDICGIDYSQYQNERWEGRRFAAIYHFLSIEHNWRLRVRVFCEQDQWPQLPSVVAVWPSANWFEREAFDLYGILFVGHPDLRRILTDYGFIGHPFRKDFPLSGHVEVRYDPDEGRVVYQPITIEPREIVPRVVREEEGYHG